MAIGWFLRHPEKLDTDEQWRLGALTGAYPLLAALRDHVRGFADMVPQLRGDRLEQWMNEVRGDDPPDCAPSSPACTATSTRSRPG